MIRFSIIIPTFNRPDALRNCLTSLRREIGADKNVELLVADDGSPAAVANENGAICREAQAQHLYTGKNRGMAVARNCGIVAAKGEWLIFMDDDVTCNAGWFTALVQEVVSFTPSIVAFEGCILPSGNGVWDREVQNRNGGACLTCHFGVRREVLDTCGMFDPMFEVVGPYCEDHEFAIRVRQAGTIVFLSHCSVTHAPRNVPLFDYVVKAPRRCRELLRSDRYLYRKHPHEYSVFRRHATFTGTYRSYRFRHLITILRRRSVKTLITHPLQTLALVVAGVIEQVTAWMLLPGMWNSERVYARTTRV